MAARMGGALNDTRLRSEEPLVVAAAAAVVAVAILPPLWAVASELLGASDALGLLGSGRLWRLLLQSLALGAAVTTLALALGVPLGVLFARADFPLRRTLFAAHVSVVFLPPFLPTLGWFHLFGREGLVGGPLSTSVLFSELGVVLVLAGCFTPVVTALTALGVRGVDASLEEAARLAAGPWRAAALVLVPCAAPVIALAGIIVFTLAFSELGVPMFLRVDVYPAVVFSRLGGMDFAPGEAALFVLPLVPVALALVGLERRFAGRRAIAALGGRGTPREPLFTANPWIVVGAALAAATSLAPLVALALRAVGRGGLSAASRWVGEAPWNGLRASALAAVVMTAVALVLGRALARRDRSGLWLDALATLSFILPSSILGVGIALAWNHPATNWLYGSYAVLVVGFVARYSAVATRTFASAVAQVPESLEEAARTVGAGYLRRLLLVGRVARRGLLGAFVLGLIFALRDLETAALFYPPGGEPLTVRIFTLEANGPPAVVSALALLHVLITLAAASVGALAVRKWRFA
jgi:iron(III) transport system permease protein